MDITQDLSRDEEQKVHLKHRKSEGCFIPLDMNVRIHCEDDRRNSFSEENAEMNEE